MTPNSEHVAVALRDGVLTLTFDRQEKLNAISPAMTADLWDAVRRLASDEEVRVLVITAVGPYFTAGIDLGSIPSQEMDPEDPASGRHMRSRYREHHLLYDEFEAVEKPVVLAAQGKCWGAGVEMGVSCDFRLASDSASFRLPEINLGVIPGSGGVSRITRLVGPGWARWMAMAGRAVDSRQALSIGLVQAVFADAEFHQSVQDFAAELAQLPTEAVALAKLAIDAADSTDRATARNVERIVNSRLSFTAEHRARVARFSGKGKS